MTSQPPAAGTLAKGYLLKHNREHKTTLIGSKYKRRWVEVTANTLLYAASEQDALTGAIQIFAIAEMLWVKAEADTKLQVKFPERTLRLKVAAGGKAERDQWVAAIQAAKKHQEEARHARKTGAGKLESLQKALLHTELSDPSTADAMRPSESGSMVLSSAGTTLDGSTSAGANSNNNSSSGANHLPHFNLTASTFGAPELSVCGQKPPSPRSLLASARAGIALVTAMSPAGTPRARAAQQPPQHAASGPAPRTQLPSKSAQEQFFMADSDGDSDAGSDDAVGTSDVEDTASDEGAEGERTTAASGTSRAHPPAPALQLPTDSPHGVTTAAAQACSSPTSSNSTQRGNLGRRVTPGVLLTPSRPTTPAGSGAAGLPSSRPLTPPHRPASGSTVPPSPLGPAPPAAAPTACAELESNTSFGPEADEVLVLDEPCCSTAAPTHEYQPRSGLTQHTGPAPTSAPAAGTSTTPTDVFSTALYRTTPRSSAVTDTGSTSAAAAGHSAGSGSGGDEVLTLDEDEVTTADWTLGIASNTKQQQQQQRQQRQQQQQQQLGAQQLVPAVVQKGPADAGWQQAGSRPGALAAVTSLAGPAGSRPGSASNGYRPGTPLKSCLRNSPGGNTAPTTNLV